MPSEYIVNVAQVIQAGPIQFIDLGLSPIALDLGVLKIRWYSLAYIVGILGGWWYLVRLLAAPGAPMARRHADDFIFWATIGIIGGGRLGYAAFYKPDMFATPLDLLKLWEGGMSFHGGLIGISLAIIGFAWTNKLNTLRVLDYVGCVTPIAVFLVRCANFVNGELYGRPTDGPLGIVFPGSGDGVARHPSQLYEAGLEGLAMGLFLWWLFWRTDARYYPGRLAGAGLIFYAVSRTLIERVREPDAGLENLWWGLTMGQTLSLPMLLVGIWLLASSGKRRQRVEPFAGTTSVA